MPPFRPSCALARLLAAPLLAVLALAFSPAAALAQAKAPSLSLDQAVTRALAADPSTAAAEARIQAAQAAARQAGLRPNPALGVDLENFAGSGAYSVLDRTEATVSYQQTFERGGKATARSAVAASEIELVRRRQDVRRLDLIKEVQVAYAEALATEAELLLAEARLVAAHRSQADIARRVRSARDPLFAGARAETLTAQAEIARDQARDTARNARAALAAFWGGGADFSLDLEAFFAAKSTTAALPPETADIALLAATRDAALARVDLERARQVADPTLRAGVRYFGEGSEVALVVGGTIPLQRYDTNRAGVERALAERNAAEADIAAARVTQAREVARLRAKLAASAAESERIRTEVIPAAIKTVDLVRAGFNRGGFQYIDVTEAERALADARARRVAVLRQHHADQAALDRLTGRFAHLASTPSAEPR